MTLRRNLDCEEKARLSQKLKLKKYPAAILHVSWLQAVDDESLLPLLVLPLQAITQPWRRGASVCTATLTTSLNTCCKFCCVSAEYPIYPMLRSPSPSPRPWRNSNRDELCADEKRIERKESSTTKGTGGCLSLANCLRHALLASVWPESR